MTDEEAVTKFLSDYYAAFSTLNIAAILPYFHEPALLVGPLGVIPLPTPAALVPVFGPAMENLRRRQYGRSEWKLRELSLLSAASALAIGVAVRLKTDGQELERVGITYLLHKTDGGWKFAVVVLHDAGEVART
jgi:hypothetical protein